MSVDNRGSDHLLLALTRKPRDVVVDSILEPHASAIESALDRCPEPALPKELQPDASRPVTFREFL